MENKIFAIGPNAYGIGKNIDSAIKNLKKEIKVDRSKIKLFECHPDTRVHPMGYFEYPQGFEPKEIK